MNRKLYVGNLPYEINENDLQALFAEAGPVESVNVVRDRETGRARGFAFVEMSTDEEAQRAITELNEYQLGGRGLTVRLPFHPGPAPDVAERSDAELRLAGGGGIVASRVALAPERGRITGSLRYRWVDTFHWVAGIYSGQVPTYGVLDLNGSYEVTEHITIGADVANMLDNDHYEAFGGDVLRRRAIGHLTYSW